MFGSIGGRWSGRYRSVVRLASALRSATEVRGHLVGSTAFKAAETGDPRLAGSIPVHLRHSVSGRSWGSTRVRPDQGVCGVPGMDVEGRKLRHRAFSDGHAQHVGRLVEGRRHRRLDAEAGVADPWVHRNRFRPPGSGVRLTSAVVGQQPVRVRFSSGAGAGGAHPVSWPRHQLTAATERLAS